MPKLCSCFSWIFLFSYHLGVEFIHSIFFMEYMLRIKTCSQHWSYVNNKEFHLHGMYILVVERCYKQTNGACQMIKNAEEKM